MKELAQLHGGGAEANSPLGIPCLIVLVGPPGSGKSTWASRHGRGAVHVSQDDLIDAITPNGFEHIYRPIYQAAEDTVAHAALEAGHTVVVDRTNRTVCHRKRWLDLACRIGCPAVAVMMTTPFAVCRARNRERQDGRRLSECRMDRMLAVYEPVGEDEGFAAIYSGDQITIERILTDLQLHRKDSELYEHCHQTR
jgi:predicted kinase